MKKNRIIAMLFIAALVFVSCQNNDTLDEELISKDLYPEVISKLKAMSFNTNDLEKVDLELPDGTTLEMFRIEGDIAFSREQIMNMKIGGSIENKQYRTNNLVSTPWWGTRTIKILGFSEGGVFDLSSKEITGLRRAVYNYNILNLDIKFSLSFGSDYAANDMVVYHNPYKGSESGGISGFPYNGDPNKWIAVYGLSSYSFDVCEHVITHEMGHSIGFRHTDWNTRQSCGYGSSGEPANPDGAVHIPGTPTGFDASSLMIACFDGTEDGEFNKYDKVALNYLY